jgi:hypothetical protein
MIVGHNFTTTKATTRMRTNSHWAYYTFCPKVDVKANPLPALFLFFSAEIMHPSMA